jgi:3'-5' exoribonuclease
MNLFKSIEKRWIQDIKVGEQLDEFYRIVEINKRLKRDGSPFLTLVLMDKTGRVPAKVWDKVEQYQSLIQDGEIYRITGLVTEYKGQKEIRIDRLNTPPNGSEIKMEDYTEEAAFDTESLFDNMIGLVKKHLTNSHLVQLTDLFAAEYKTAFKSHYGAQKIHHAYLGGLLEHTNSIIKLAIQIADHYSLDKDVLLTGALFHDSGKMFEFTTAPAVGMTLEGGLLGHLIIGNELFTKLTNQVPGFPEELAIMIRHLIISHHGEREFGSPEIPKTREAYALHVLDLLDSKLKIFDQIIEAADKNQMFSDYIPVLERRIFVPGNE